MKDDKLYAVAFIHTPSNETGRSEYVFNFLVAKQMSEELDKVCKTILHFPLAQGEDIRERAKQRKKLQS